VTADDIKKLRAIAQTATPGPWRLTASRTGIVAAVDDSWICTVSRITPVTDVEFIAAANPQAVLALIDDIEHANTAARTIADKAADFAVECAKLEFALTMMTAARDEACDIADTAIRMRGDFIGRHDQRGSDRIVELKKVGEP
jgi:hypothetical protein